MRAELRGESQLLLRLRERKLHSAIHARRRGDRAGQQAGIHEFIDAFAECLRDESKILLRVRGREEAGPAFPSMHAAQPQMMKEQAAKFQLRRNGEIVAGAEARPAQRDAAQIEVRVQLRHEAPGRRVQLLLQRGAARLDLREHRLRSGQRERVAHEGSGEKRDADLRRRVVAEIPRAAVERIEEARVARDDPDRQPAAEHLAIGADVRLDPEQSLRAPRMAAEAGHDFIHHERDVALRGQPPQLMEEFARLQFRLAALHGLDEHRREFVRVAADGVERRVAAVFEHEHIRDGRVGNPRRDGRGGIAGARTHEHLVEDAVIRTGEDRDLVAPRDRARHADRRHHRLGTRVAEGRAVHAGQLAHERGDFTRERRGGADLDAAVELRLDRRDDEWRAMAEEDLAEAERDIDVFVPVDVPQFCAERAIHHERIDDLLERAAEAGDRARVGEVRAMLRGVTLRARGALAVARDQRIDVALLLRGDFRRGRRVDAAEWAVPHRRARGLCGAGGDFCGSSDRRHRGGILAEIFSERTECAEFLEELPEAQADAELLLQRDRDLREEERVEAESHQRRVRAGAGQIEAGKLGDESGEFRERIGCVKEPGRPRPVRLRLRRKIGAGAPRLLGRLRPVTLPLERVGRQRHLAPLAAARVRGPVDLFPSQPAMAERHHRVGGAGWRRCSGRECGEDAPAIPPEQPAASFGGTVGNHEAPVAERAATLLQGERNVFDRDLGMAVEEVAELRRRVFQRPQAARGEHDERGLTLGCRALESRAALLQHDVRICPADAE